MHLSLLRAFPLLSFASFGLLCLQVSSVSNFHPDMWRRKWPLIRAHLLSCALERKDAEKKNTAGMCGECSQWIVHSGLPQPRWRVLPRSKALRCAMRTQSQVSRASCALPRSKPLRLQVHHEGRVSGMPSVLCTSQVQAAQALGYTASTQSQLGHASYQGS